MKKPLSLKGYILGARTQERSFSPLVSIAPPPTQYQPSNTQPKDIKKPLKPFNSSADRFSRHGKKEVIPGPGTYELDVERNRSVQMLHTFGGRVTMVPVVNYKCTINNTDCCENCNEKVKGDYYEFKKHVLCTTCFEYNLKWQEKYTRS